MRRGRNGGASCGGGGNPPPPPTLEPLTGVWQGSVDAGTETAILRLTITEDAGVLAGWKYINDPSAPSGFVMLQTFSGTRNGNSISLVTLTETITATLDGGVLYGVDPLTEPSEFLDAGQAPTVTLLPFAMNRITQTVVPPDAGDYR